MTVKNADELTIKFIDTDSKSFSITPISQQEVIKKFMRSLDDSEIITTSAIEALNVATEYASGGLYQTWSELIAGFVSDVSNHGGADHAGGNGGEYLIGFIPYADTKRFLINYCGIDLTNDDTGSITGWDAGGTEVKTDKSVVPENGTISDLQSPPGTETTINGLTFHWPTASNDLEQAVIDRLYTWWAQEGLNLVEESYGLSFREEGTTVTDISVQFVNDTNSTASAACLWDYYKEGQHIGETHTLVLEINLAHFNNLDLTDVSGYNGSWLSSTYLDRTLAHEFTHAAMTANVTGFSELPICLLDGLAELVHGIDDERKVTICKLAQSSNVDALMTALTAFGYLNTVDEQLNQYAGGYMLLRYLAKQVSDASFSFTPLSSVNGLASDMSNALNLSPDMYSWSDNSIGVADSVGQMSTTFGGVSDALLSFGSSGTNSFVTDSLSVMIDEKKSLFYS